MMAEILASEVSDKDVADYIRDYAVPRVRMMRAMLALGELASPVKAADKIPEFVMSTGEYAAFRRILGEVARTESMAWAFDPETRRDVLLTGRMGTIFGIMPLMIDNSVTGIACRACEMKR